MKGVLINPVERSCREVEYDNEQSLLDLLECTHLDSRKVSSTETVVYGGDLKPDSYDGFVMPLEHGTLRVMGKALVLGVEANRHVAIARCIFWAGVEHVVS